MGAIIYGSLNAALEKFLLAEIKENLINETKLAALIADKAGEALYRDAPAIAAAVGTEVKARVTVISKSGEVVGDSEVAPSQLQKLENHLDRPEIEAANKEGLGTAIRYSSTLSMPMLYVARTIILKSGEKGTIRLALPLKNLEKARSHMQVMLVIALSLALLAGGFFSYFLSNLTSSSLRAISSIASRIGRGEYGLRAPVESRDEVGELALTINDMSVKIEAQMERMVVDRNRLDTILNGMGEGLLVIDAQGTITLVNPAFRKLFAIDEEVVGKPLIEVSRQPALHEVFRKVITDSSKRQEELTLGTEQEKTILTHWVPLLDGLKLQGVVAVFHDISDIKRMAAARRDFIANVSHELRTPVAVIQGYAETLLAGTLESDQNSARRFIQIIHNHSERLSSLISDLLSLSELESGRILLDPRPLRLKETVSKVIALLAQKVSAKGIDIDASNMDEELSVLADRDKLEQVLINLLDNALKYSPEQSSITITAIDAGEMLKISITDNGLGIPAKDLPRIFERFFRVDEARSRDQGGTGLGLSIVKHIIQAHGGMISVESVPGKGSTFSFTLKKAEGTGKKAS